MVHRTGKSDGMTVGRLLSALVIVAFAAWPFGHRSSAVAQSSFEHVISEAAEREAYAIAFEAYVYGYPRVELARRIRNETSRVAEDQVIYAQANRFFYFRRLSRPGDGRFIKGPNNDTVYASAYLDLSQGPVALRVPSVGDRLYVALLVDAAGSVVQRLSRRVSGPGGVDHVFIGPGQTAPTAPQGAQVIRVAGADVWMLMRLATDGSPADEAEAVRLIRGFRLAPLGDAGQLDRPQPEFPVKDLPLSAPFEPFGKLAFFHEMSRMLVRHPVPTDDRGLLARWERIGLKPGGFDERGLSAPVRAGIERAIADAEKNIVAAQFGIATTVNGWNYSLKIGRTGNDWALNAAIARGGYGNLPEDSVYYQRTLDAEGSALSGERRYTMRFPAGAMPPVGAFWSITAYDMRTFDLIENSMKRYSLGDRTPGLVRNADGSLTIAIQKDAPVDAALRANWLPVGEGPFYLIIRTYDPDAAIIEGRWAPPDLARR